jgi:hypothetical protein
MAALVLAACHAGPPPAPAPVARRPPPPIVTPGDLDANVLFGDVPARAVRLGAGPASMVTSGEAVEGERLGAFVDLPDDVCLLAYARASSSVEDLDLAALDDDGSSFAQDNADDPHPAILVCPPHPARLYVMAHVVLGEGLVGVAAHLVPRASAPEVAHALGAHGTLDEGPQSARGIPGLEDHVRAHREAIGGEWQDFEQRILNVDARVPVVFRLPIEADQCVDALVMPLSEEVALLEVEAVDEGGRVVARAHEGGPDRSITMCSPIRLAGSLLVRPHVGRGQAIVTLGRMRASAARDLSPKVDVAWTPTSVPLDAARAERADALAKAGYGSPTFASKGALVLGRRASFGLDAPRSNPPGTCTRVDVIGGAPLALVDARAWAEPDAPEAGHGAPGGASTPASGSPSALSSEASGAWSTTLFACARVKTRVDVEAHGRGGPFALEARAEKWRDPAFAQHPLAASRMLARAAEGTAATFPGLALPARAVTLEPDRMLAWTSPVPAGRCAQVSVGAEGDGAGLELRAFDAPSGDEVDRSHAARAVEARACAPTGAGRSIRWELRTTSGRLDVVVGERDW